MSFFRSMREHAQSIEAGVVAKADADFAALKAEPGKLLTEAESKAKSAFGTAVQDVVDTLEAIITDARAIAQRFEALIATKAAEAAQHLQLAQTAQAQVDSAKAALAALAPIIPAPAPVPPPPPAAAG